MLNLVSLERKIGGIKGILSQYSVVGHNGGATLGPVEAMAPTKCFLKFNLQGRFSNGLCTHCTRRFLLKLMVVY